MDVRDNIADLAAFGGVVRGSNAVSLHDIDVQNVGALPVQAGDEIVAQFGGEFGKVAISFT